MRGAYRSRVTTVPLAEVIIVTPWQTDNLRNVRKKHASPRNAPLRKTHPKESKSTGVATLTGLSTSSLQTRRDEPPETHHPGSPSPSSRDVLLKYGRFPRNEPK